MKLDHLAMNAFTSLCLAITAIALPMNVSANEEIVFNAADTTTNGCMHHGGKHKRKKQNVTFAFSIGGITDPNATAIGFAEVSNSLKQVSLSALLGAVPPLTYTGSLTTKVSPNETVLFGIRIFTPNGIFTSGRSPSPGAPITVTVTRGGKSTIYEMTPSSNSLYIGAGLTGVFEYVLPASLL